MIEVYRDGRLLLVCSARDWKRFLPGVSDGDFVWRGYVHDEQWSWCWAPA